MKLFLKLLLAGALLGAPAAARAQSPDYIAAIVGDSLITYWQIFSEINRLSPATSDAAFQARLRAIYHDLRDNKVILQEFKRLEKSNGAKIPDNIIDYYVEVEIRKNHNGDRAEFARWLRVRGMTTEEFRTQMRDDIIVNELVRKFVPEPIISPKKIEAYYQAHQQEFLMDERVRYRWIVLNQSDTTRALVEEIASQAKEGVDFDELAKVHSRFPQRPKDWQEVQSMDEPLRKGLSQIKPGECTGVIESSGVFVIMRLDEREASHTKPLSDDQVQADIKKNLTDSERTVRKQTWLRRLGDRTFIKQFIAD
jgi:parvulin-like peptidyl-prolyl isomerase